MSRPSRRGGAVPFLLLAVLAGLGACRGTAEPAAPLRALRTILLPDVRGRIDHLAYDETTQRLFVVALGQGELLAVDLARGELAGRVVGLASPQGVAVLPALHRVVVACGGDGSVRAFDGASLQPLGQVALGDDADNVRVLPDGALLVGYGGGALAELDPSTLAVRGRVGLDGHPEAFQVARDGRVFANVPGSGSRGTVAAIVRRRAGDLAAVAAWPLPDLARNYPLAYDEARQRLYVGCRQPARLAVVDAADGRVLAALPCVDDADDVFVDGDTVFAIGGGGRVSLFRHTDGGLVAAGQLDTASGARTGLCVPGRRALYVAAPAAAGRPAALFEFALP